MASNISYPILWFSDSTAWECWLQENAESAKGVWLKIAKKGGGVTSVSYAEALEGALCFGWIDGQKGALDDEFWLQKFTPRGARSGWSQINREKAEALITAGRMRAAGQRQVDLARADGRWDAAYESQRTIRVPDDLQRAFDENPSAAAFFASLNSVNRYAILYRVTTAKKTDTRAERIRRLVAMLERGEKIYP